MQQIQMVNRIQAGQQAGQVTLVPQAVQASVPFEEMLDTAMHALGQVSRVEQESNDTIRRYLNKKASIEEVVLATSKWSLTAAVATSVVSNAVESFKQIQQIPV
ncbi:MAG: flagellar hook-basal body complex protein FliE [Candidatus Margulisiibacteriota bacterium]